MLTAGVESFTGGFNSASAAAASFIIVSRDLRFFIDPPRATALKRLSWFSPAFFATICSVFSWICSLLTGAGTSVTGGSDTLGASVGFCTASSILAGILTSPSSFSGLNPIAT